MEQSLVLTFDVGTQSARCLLVIESGDFEDKEQQKYKVPYLSKQPGWAEQTPDFYFNIIAEMSKKVIEKTFVAVRISFDFAFASSTISLALTFASRTSSF